ncbi:hypothetical protein ACWGSK_07140 [Nocardiopsis sp. NPDC055551]
MRIATMAPAAAVLLTVSVGACGSEPATTSGDEQRTTESPGEEDPGGGDGSGAGGGSGGSGGDGGSGGSGGDGGRGGQPGEPSAEEEIDPPQEDEGEGESTDGPVMLALGASHRFEDGFTVTMSSVERLTEPAPDRSDTSADDVPSEDEPLDEDPVEETTEDDALEEAPEEEPTEAPADEPTVENEESEEELLGEEPTDDPVDEETVEETAEETDEPISEEPVDEEPTEEESEEEGDDYYAWSVEITNGTGEDRHTGSVLTSCSVGSPLTESSAPLLGAALEPPMVLSTDETGSWDEDCWADEDDPTLQWTLEFIDEQGRSLYPPLIFEGRVD